MEEAEKTITAGNDLRIRLRAQADNRGRGRDRSLLANLFKLACWRLAQPHTLHKISRLVGEGAGSMRRLWTQARNEREIRRLLDAGKDVAFMVSFYRSGNTWMRCLLADILLQNSGAETSTLDSDRTGEMVPDIYNNVMAGCRARAGEPLLVKTHETFEGVRRCWTAGTRCPGEGSGAGKVKHFYLYRNPEDVLVSYYHFRRFESPAMGRWTGLESFCRAEFPRWIEHVCSYLRACDRGVEVFFMSYESLLQDTAAALGSMLRWLEIDHTDANIRRAVSNMQFGKLRALEETRRKDAEEYFFRKGLQGSGAWELSSESVRRIRDAAAAVVARAEERAAVCRSQWPALGKLVGPRGLAGEEVLNARRYARL